ncbi:MAG: hypothetical protein Ct9H300mP8_06630 [Gammaproteobacteria bacterium]|nr:MAG: hypothetical protein Ct9H300mP8_06630 [Gammaproteobacteria bacterium]
MVLERHIESRIKRLGKNEYTNFATMPWLNLTEKFIPKMCPFAFGELEKKIVRERVLNGEPRIDGRDLKTVRPISVEVGTLPKTHGSALFQRARPRPSS